MQPRIITGSKEEIAREIAALKVRVQVAIVFFDDADAAAAMAGIAAMAGAAGGELPQDIFAEMEPFTVRQGEVDDSREAVYRRVEGE